MTAPASSYPWRDGVYKATNCFYDSVTISGCEGVAMGMGWTIQTGDYGETDRDIRERNAQERYNIQSNWSTGEML